MKDANKKPAQLYRGTLPEEAGDKDQLVFACEAEDADDAAEQALGAYPGGEVINCTGLPSRYVVYSANEAAINDGAGFWNTLNGWTTLEGASLFSRSRLYLPMSTGNDAKFVPLAHFLPDPGEPQEAVVSPAELLDLLREEMREAVDSFATVTALSDELEAKLDKLQADNACLTDALQTLMRIIEAAGIGNLARGVQLGSTVWQAKMQDAWDHAEAVLARARLKERNEA